MANARALIDRLPPDAPDDVVASLVALHLLERERMPYWFSIDHDIRPPAMKACPLDFDWAKKDRVGIKTMSREKAEVWIIKAALHGYTIRSENLGEVLTMSLRRARELAKWAQTLDDDSDIPF